MLPWLVENTILACLLAIGVSAVCRLFCPRPAIRHAMWLLVLVKLIVPPMPQLAWRLPDTVWFSMSPSDEIVKPGALAHRGRKTETGEIPQRAAAHISDVDVAAAAPVGDPSTNASISHLPGKSPLLAGDATVHDTVASPRLATPQSADLDSVEKAAGDRWTDHADFEASISASIAGEGPSVVIESIEFLSVEEVADQAVPQTSTLNEDSTAGTEPAVLLSSALHSEQANRIAAYLWLFLTAGMAVFELGRVLRFRRLALRAQPASGWLVRQVECAARQMRIRPPEVLVTSGCCSPVLWTLGRPRLLWPDRLTSLLSTEAMQGVIVHELAHLARRDHWVRRLELVAGCVWWWHPLFWLVRRQLHENAELACDAWVISAYPHGRRAYAQALIEVIDFSQQRTLPAPALGAGDVTRRTFERRLRMIMRERIQSRVSLAAGVLLLLACVAVLPGFSRGQDADAPDATPIPGEAIADDAASFPTVAEAVGDFFPSADDAGAESEPAAAIAEPGDLPALNSTGIADTDPALALPESAATAAVLDSAPSDEIPAIRRLEEQLEKLMQEVKALRFQGDPRDNHYRDSTGSNYGDSAWNLARAAAAQATSAPAPGRYAGGGSHRGATSSGDASDEPVPATNPNATTATVRTLAGASVLLGGSSPSKSDYAAYGATNVRMLTRVTYGLPEGKAQALARFLDEQAGDKIESIATRTSLVVTASEADQQIVGRFVALIASAKGSRRTQDTRAPFDPRIHDSGASQPAEVSAPGFDDLLSAPVDESAPGFDVQPLDAGESSLNVPFDEASEPMDSFGTPDDGGSDLDPFSGDESVDN